MGEKGNEYRLFVGKPEGKRPLERPIIIILSWILEREYGGGGDGIGLTQDRDKLRALVNAVMSLAGRFSSWTTGGLLHSAQFHRVS
jgi:hypothetical protein